MHYSLIHAIASLAKCGDAIALRILQMPFLDDAAQGGYYDARDGFALDWLSGVAHANLEELEELLAHPELAGGISGANTATALLLILERDNAEAAAAIQALPWVEDGIRYIDPGQPGRATERDEASHAIDLTIMARRSPNSFWPFIAKPWVQDGYSRAEYSAILDISAMTWYDDTGTTRLLGMPFLESLSLDDKPMTSFLSRAAFERRLQQLLSSPKLEGGIRDGDLALVMMADAELQNPNAAAPLNERPQTQN